jgi:hypothetical protein
VIAERNCNELLRILEHEWIGVCQGFRQVCKAVGEERNDGLNQLQSRRVVQHQLDRDQRKVHKPAQCRLALLNDCCKVSVFDCLRWTDGGNASDRCWFRRGRQLTFATVELGPGFGAHCSSCGSATRRCRCRCRRRRTRLCNSGRWRCWRSDRRSSGRVQARVGQVSRCYNHQPLCPVFDGTTLQQQSNVVAKNADLGCKVVCGRQ